MNLSFALRVQKNGTTGDRHKGMSHTQRFVKKKQIAILLSSVTQSNSKAVREGRTDSMTASVFTAAGKVRVKACSSWLSANS